MNKKNLCSQSRIKKIANSFQDDLNKDLKKSEFKKVYKGELLKLRIADEIVKLRKKQKMSQKQLAEKIKTTQAVISRIENAQVFPGTEILERICDKCNVEVEFRFR